MIDPSVAFGTDACIGRSPQAGCKHQFRNTSRIKDVALA